MQMILYCTVSLHSLTQCIDDIHLWMQLQLNKLNVSSLVQGLRNRKSQIISDLCLWRAKVKTEIWL